MKTQSSRSHCDRILVVSGRWCCLARRLGFCCHRGFCRRLSRFCCRRLAFCCRLIRARRLCDRSRSQCDRILVVRHQELQHSSPLCSAGAPARPAQLLPPETNPWPGFGVGGAHRMKRGLLRQRGSHWRTTPFPNLTACPLEFCETSPCDFWSFVSGEFLTNDQT